MAAFVRTPALQFPIDPSWVAVILRLSNMQLFEGRHEDIVAWIETDEVPGTVFFYHREWTEPSQKPLPKFFDPNMPHKGRDHVYVFDNPDAAFEFKLRWA
jgi:hypothetical protein